MAKLGSARAKKSVVAWPNYSEPEQKQQKTIGMFDQSADHFVERNGLKFAGTHLIIDLWGAKNVDDIALMERAMREAVQVAGATLLHIHLHHFTPNNGISGVAVLAESHISVHTWPERGFAAFDIFMCGDAKPHKAIKVLRKHFAPTQIVVNEQMRGCTAE